MEATRLLRQRGFAGLIVGVTGHVFDDDVALFSDAGADLVLAKPLCFATVQMLLTFIADSSADNESGSDFASIIPRPSSTHSRLVQQNNRLCWKT